MERSRLLPMPPGVKRCTALPKRSITGLTNRGTVFIWSITSCRSTASVRSPRRAASAHTGTSLPCSSSSSPLRGERRASHNRGRAPATTSSPIIWFMGRPRLEDRLGDLAEPQGADDQQEGGAGEQDIAERALEERRHVVPVHHINEAEHARRQQPHHPAGQPA